MVRPVNRDTVPTHVKRSFAADLRASRSGGTLEGHAAVFNSLSEDLGGWRERIAPGAFDAVIGAEDIYALWNHDPNFIIASTADKTLRLSQDGTGLLAEMDPMDTQTIRDLVVTPIKQGKVRKMSFAFDIPVGGDEWVIEDGTEIRVIRKVGRLYDVSPVTYPAYPGTDISARTLQTLIRSLPRAAVLSALRQDMDQESCEAEGGEWVDGMCVMSMRAMTQEDCEAQGGKWEDGMCMMPMANSSASSVAPRLALPSDGRSDTQAVWAEIYGRRLRRHESAFQNIERTPT